MGSHVKLIKVEVNPIFFFSLLLTLNIKKNPFFQCVDLVCVGACGARERVRLGIVI